MHTHFDRPEELFEAAVDRFVETATKAIRARGRFVLALSGGSTPVPVYGRLAGRGDIDGAGTHVFWSDERCVAPEDPMSNFAAAKVALLDRIDIPDSHVHRIAGERPPNEAADAYEREVREVVPDGRFDLILLGMGLDGHTASLFPEHPALLEAKRWFLAVHAPARPPWRVTMTLPLIERGRHVLFLLVGREKTRVFRRIEDDARAPAALVRPSDGTITWYTCNGP